MFAHHCAEDIAQRVEGIPFNDDVPDWNAGGATDPKEMILKERIRTLSSYVNFTPQTGVKADQIQDLRESADPAFRERTILAFDVASSGDRVSNRRLLIDSGPHAIGGRAGAYSKIANSAATQYTLGYNYNLSKRTKLYGFWTKTDNQKNGAYDPVGGLGKGNDFSSLAAGIRHNF